MVKPWTEVLVTDGGDATNSRHFGETDKSMEAESPKCYHIQLVLQFINAGSPYVAVFWKGIGPHLLCSLGIAVSENDGPDQGQCSYLQSRQLLVRELMGYSLNPVFPTPAKLDELYKNKHGWTSHSYKHPPPCETILFCGLSVFKQRKPHQSSSLLKTWRLQLYQYTKCIQIHFLAQSVNTIKISYFSKSKQPHPNSLLGTVPSPCQPRN